MNKYKIILLTLLMFVFTTNIYAVCNDKELIDSAQKIEVNFIEDSDHEITVTDSNGKEMKTFVERQYAYILTFTPYNENLLVAVKSGNTLIESTYDDFYKAQFIGSTIHYSPKTYTIYVISQNEKSCYSDLLRTFDYTVPAFNEFSISTFCKENPSVKECAINYDSSKLNEKKINEIVEKTNIKNTSTKEKMLYNVKKYWYFVLIPIIIISIIYIIKIFAYKRKVNRI